MPEEDLTKLSDAELEARGMTDEQLAAAQMTDSKLQIEQLKALSIEDLLNTPFTPAEATQPAPETTSPSPETSTPAPETSPSDGGTTPDYGDGSCGGFPSSKPDEEKEGEE